jgi:hypothetical protein
VFGKRSLAVGVVLGFLLSALVFAVLPVGSQWQRQYDPWADINDDGKIDAKDIGYVCTLYGKSGDPAKTVIIGKHEAFFDVRNGTITSPGYYYYFNATGWDRISIAIKVKGTAAVYCCWWWGSRELPPIPYAWFNVTNSEETRTYSSQVMAPLFYVYYTTVNGVLNCYTVIAFYATT